MKLRSKQYWTVRRISFAKEKLGREDIDIEKLNRLICVLAEYFAQKITPKLTDASELQESKAPPKQEKAPEKKLPEADIMSSELIEQVGKAWKIANDEGQVAFIGGSCVEKVERYELYLKEAFKWVANKIQWKEDEKK